MRNCIINKKKGRRGIALIVAMIFLAVFSTLSVSLMTMSSANAHMANNHRAANHALANAQSGLEIARYWLSSITLTGEVDPDTQLQQIFLACAENIQNAEIDHFRVNYSAENNVISTTNISFSDQIRETCSVSISQNEDGTIRVQATGASEGVSRSIQANFGLATVGSGVFNFGVATKGPLSLTGQTELEGTTLAIEASVYIEGNDAVDGDSFSITNNASVAGDVSISSSNATVSVGDGASVGGATGEAIYDHIHFGAEGVVFPEPDPEYFRPFATGEVIDENSDWDNYSTLTNVVIAANTNPTFSSNVTINGVLFIETPNNVTFAGKATVNAVIVGNGSIYEESSANSLTFAGQVVANDVSTLEGEEFAGIKEETGTFVMAPGFSLDFSGQALSMSGVIAGSGISFSGQAGGTVNGSIINYSQTPMTLSGQTELMFNRSGPGSDPSGFTSNHVLEFNPTSYSEG